MKSKIIVIISLVALVLVSAFFVWRHIHGVARKIEPVRKKVAARVREPAPAAPRLAIVMDDFGYNMNNIDALFSIGEPVTLSILPGLPYSRRIAQRASARGYETILHLPLESHRKDVREESNTIRSGMSDEEVIARLAIEIESIPGLSGVSNHMGSKSTEDRALMTVIFGYLRKNNLYFLDSLTSQKTVCKAAAAAAGLRFARRDVFLDNSSDSDYIKKQLMEARRVAFKRGRAIAICHDRRSTIAVLAEMMPQMKKTGIRFVRLSELVK